MRAMTDRSFFASMMSLSHARKLAGVTALAAAACFLYQTGEEGMNRTLATEEKKPFYDKTCPFEFNVGAGGHLEEALQYSFETELDVFIKEALEANADHNGKIVLAGDSNTRQIFASIACTARTLGFWKDNESYTVTVSKHSYNDARVELKDGEVFFAPSAGGVQSYAWGSGKCECDTMHGEQDWLQSCKDRKPFYLDTYTYDAPNERVPEWSKDDERFENVLLLPTDNVIFNNGLHHTRAGNTENFNELLDCMAEARTKGEDPGWPKISYFRSNQQHFDGDTGEYKEAKVKSGECAETADQSKNAFLKEELELYTGKVPMIGYDLDLGPHGRLHVGGRKIDCSHWTTPGVPDAYAKELLSGVFELTSRKE